MNDLMDGEFEHIVNSAQTLLDQANEMYRKGKDQGTVMSVLLIATSARQMLAPEVKYVALDYSDQGNFLSLWGALNAEKVDLYEDAEDMEWETFSDEAESSFAWNLDTEDRHLWQQYLTPAEPSGVRAGGPSYLLDVDDVIARIGATL